MTGRSGPGRNRGVRRSGPGPHGGDGTAVQRRGRMTLLAIGVVGTGLLLAGCQQIAGTPVAAAVPASSASTAATSAVLSDPFPASSVTDPPASAAESSAGSPDAGSAGSPDAGSSGAGSSDAGSSGAGSSAVDPPSADPTASPEGAG
ncbi:MAG TPA: hypothetical protein VFM01_18115, partial [Nakamurella sp.]|nr:hypothetical protein [Nakamurella sp.]